MAMTKQVPHLRWSQAPPLPWRRPGSADISYILGVQKKSPDDSQWLCGSFMPQILRPKVRASMWWRRVKPILSRRSFPPHTQAATIFDVVLMGMFQDVRRLRLRNKTWTFWTCCSFVGQEWCITRSI